MVVVIVVFLQVVGLFLQFYATLKVRQAHLSMCSHSEWRVVRYG